MAVPVDAEEAVTVALWELSTLGIQVQDEGDTVTLIAYFTDRPAVAADLAAALAPLSGVRIEPAAIPDVDWVTRFREGFRTFAAGRFLIVPAWDQPPCPEPGQRLLIVDPGRAFGTGTHETTRLCLAALEELSTRNPLGRTLDLGTGSGILALAAAALGAHPVVGVDNDPEAVANARRHAALNGTALHLVLADGAAPFATASFDLVLANVTAPVLLAARDAIAAVRAPTGRLVLSGLLAEDVGSLQDRYAALGRIAVRTEGEWAALLVEGAA